LARGFARSLRSGGSLAALVRGSFRPWIPTHRHSLAASPARSVPVAHSLRSFAVHFAPGPPTPSLARGFARSLRSGGSLAALVRGSLRPWIPTHRHSLAASPARSVPVAHSLRSFAVHFAPGPPTPSLARGFARSLRSGGSLAALVRGSLRPW